MVEIPSIDLFELREIINSLPVDWEGSGWDDDLMVEYDFNRGGLRIFHNDVKAQLILGDYGFIDFEKGTVEIYKK